MAFRFREIQNHNKCGTTNLHFNMSSMDEVTVYFDSDYCDSESISDIEIMIDDEWKSVTDAIKDKDIIPDNYNTYLDIPKSEQEREQGFNW